MAILISEKITFNLEKHQITEREIIFEDTTAIENFIQSFLSGMVLSVLWIN